MAEQSWRRRTSPGDGKTEQRENEGAVERSAKVAEEKPSHPYVVEGADGQSRSGWQWISVFLGWGLLQSGKTVTVTVTGAELHEEPRAGPTEPVQSGWCSCAVYGRSKLQGKGDWKDVSVGCVQIQIIMEEAEYRAESLAVMASDDEKV
ncbi:uncharacterized protein VDAG_08527 [Verticillium dahliae VdLs.17]|uniref:Uncharacterized protein n=1 Tax=Verticillium dahliae (strain VdLs.17 / ATCC MYA-4575 / FGSC 10137) TaxID=498257 RepID=G2XEE2_VERDV|nr:uncharacterized protein VDAG_08527 [Verticillium dahliae VdLs.17]EGY18193.1 hypothetical protein VDAG_08527 [Verticillium dahliae VdLs.17]